MPRSIWPDDHASSGSPDVSQSAPPLLYRLRFGVWFRLLLENESGQRRTALLLFALEAAMEAFLILQKGIQPEYLAVHDLLVITMAALTAGLAEQADEGELDELRATLAELDAGFDRRIGEKIQASTQLGNVRVPQVRSLLLSKLTAMGEKGIDFRLEVLYLMVTAEM